MVAVKVAMEDLGLCKVFGPLSFAGVLLGATAVSDLTDTFRRCFKFKFGCAK